MVGEVVLRIHPLLAYIKVESKDEKGVVSTKEITNESLVECLRSNIKQQGINSGLLPENCVSFYSTEDNEKKVSLLHPERYGDITYYGILYKHFPLPRLIYKFSLHEGHRVNAVSVCVVEEGRLKPESKLYEYPFSNVTGFRMCIGNNVMPKCKSLHTLQSLTYHIVSIPDNNDHFAHNQNRLKMPYRELVEHMKDKEPGYYYEQVLLPSGKTLRDFIEEA
jgi:hypothetical protein